VLVDMQPKRLLLILVVLCCVIARDARSDEPDVGYVVIVHPDNPIGELSRGFLQNAFLKKTVAWGDGEGLRPVDLSRRFAVRAQFVREVLKKTPVQLRSYWNQQIFSGKGSPPPERETEAAVVAYVLANRGAIGYLSADADPGRARVVRVK
jgi:ABC-type phosphate transport system substrate-binding protein